jgi:hypothetical protein
MISHRSFYALATKQVEPRREQVKVQLGSKDAVQSLRTIRLVESPLGDFGVES